MKQNNFNHLYTEWLTATERLTAICYEHSSHFVLVNCN